jgi:AAA+ superfamily predicted ATPase
VKLELGNTDFLKKKVEGSKVGEVTPQFNSLQEKEVVIEEYMSITTIRTYPNGSKFIDTKTWFKGKKQNFKKRSKKKKKVQFDDTVEEEVI